MKSQNGWKNGENENKSAHITFTLKKAKYPSVSLNGSPIPQTAVVKYLGMHLDQRLIWAPHIINKRKQVGLINVLAANKIIQTSTQQ